MFACVSVVEADGDTGEMHGTVSMSAQFAPYDAEYGMSTLLLSFSGKSCLTQTRPTEWNEVIPEGYEIWPDNYGAHINNYKGGVLQQAVSALPETDQLSYHLLNSTRFNTYGFEYQPSVRSFSHISLLLSPFYRTSLLMPFPSHFHRCMEMASSHGNKAEILSGH